MFRRSTGRIFCLRAGERQATFSRAIDGHRPRLQRVENWLRGRDLNPRPSGYEPDELPGCSTPRLEVRIMPHRTANATANKRSQFTFFSRTNRIAGWQISSADADPKMIVHLIDGTYELFRHFYGLRRFNKGVDRPYGAVVGVLQGVLQMIE